MTVRVVLLAALLVGISCPNVSSDSRSKKFLNRAMEVWQGDIVELKLSAKGVLSVESRMGKEPIRFYRSEDGSYVALVGIDLEAKPGLATVEVTGATSTGEHRHTQIELDIRPKKFQKESFSVPASFDQFSPEILERIRSDQVRFAQSFAASAAERLWVSPFIMPVQAEISSSFGYRRIINGTPRAPHTGVDLRAPMGTEVHAANNGRVVLSGDFFFSGNSLVLDHGGGLYTMYFHLAEFKVAAGAEVRKGDVIALSGMTGRVTGPHLHWGARLNGARIDPFELIRKLSGGSREVVEWAGAGDKTGK